MKHHVITRQLVRAVAAVAAFTLVACRPLEITGGQPAGPGIYAVYLSPAGYALIVGETVQLAASATTRECDLVFCHESQVSASFTWRSSDPTIVTVAGGLVRPVAPGTAYVTAETDGVTGSAEIRVGRAYVPLARVSPGGRCALTVAGAAYCWGGLSFNSPDTALVGYMPRRLAGHLTFTSITGGSAEACGITADGRGYCWGNGGDARPVAGGLTFRSLSAGRRDAVNPGNEHACGVAVDGSAWCWGAHDAGQLGTEATLPTCFNGEIGHDYPCSNTPVRVAGGLALMTISAGGKHTCALAADGAAYCWGDNTWGQLGDDATVSRAAPAPVRGVPPLASLAAGRDHTCGLTGRGEAFCWGRNDGGQLGSGSRDAVPHSVPTPVAGSVAFASLDAAGWTCALTPAGDAYCWGEGVIAPTRVGAGLVFRSVGVASRVWPPPTGEACGIGSDARGYCWTGTGSPFPLVGPIQP
ncbi:MAG TPA: hypothetical protein VFU41_01020 [Gemmatimonadales bacterium]|nr:hypothetical protein [Gemmatimonadales bacterium]